MKKSISAIAAIAGLAAPVVALAAQPNPSVIYAGKGGISIYPGARGSHSLWETRTPPGFSYKAAPCSSKYVWDIGRTGQLAKPSTTFRSNAPIKIGRSGRWSATRPNQDKKAKKAKIHVSGVFTSKNGGHGTWQVVGCAKKHSFTFKPASL